MVIDYGMLAPEINSGRMYAGPGSGPLLGAAAAWNAVATELHAAAALYSSAIAGLTARWRGASSLAMATAVAPYVAWMTATAARAEQTANQNKAAAAAFETAFAAMVPPPVIAAKAAAVTHATEMTAGMHTQTLPQFMTATPSLLHNFASPFSAAPVAAAADPSAPSSLASSLSDINSFITGPLSPVSLFSIGGVPQLLGVQCYLLPQAGANLAAAADKLATTPAASGADSLVSQAPALGPAISAGMGRGGLVGGLSVPQGWAMAAPAVKPVAAVFAESSPASAAAATVTQGQGTLLGNMALSGLAGRAIAGTGGTAAARQLRPAVLPLARPAAQSTSSSSRRPRNDHRRFGAPRHVNPLRQQMRRRQLRCGTAIFTTKVRSVDVGATQKASRCKR